MPEDRQQVRRDRRAFASTALLGVAASALAAVSAARDWFSGTGNAAGVRASVVATGGDVAPLTGALALVALAAWGVLLVTRGAVRTVVAAVGALSALGSLAALLVGFAHRHHAVADLLRDKGATGVVTLGVRGWVWVGALATLVSPACLLVACRRARTWPAMGSRYDAPAARAGRTGEPRTDLEVWKAMDEGEDPTAGEPGDSP